MAQDSGNQMEEDYEAPFGPDDSVLVKDLHFSYGDRKVGGRRKSSLRVPFWDGYAALACGTQERRGLTLTCI